jgi:hypothetical protein
MSKTQPKARDEVRTTDRRAIDFKLDINVELGHVGVGFNETGH